MYTSNISYTIVPTLKYNPDGVNLATWDGEKWDFGAEGHSFPTLDEALDQLEKAKQDTENIEDINLQVTLQDDESGEVLYATIKTIKL